MPTVERQNARAEYERGWREGAEAMRDKIMHTLYEEVTFVKDTPLPEPPKEEPERKEAEPNV